MNFQMSDFDFIDCPMTRKCMQNGCWALTHANLWDWLRVYEVDPACGFMFTNEPEIYVIDNIMGQNNAPVHINHSGASFGITMRNLDYIAKNGFEAYKTLYLKRKHRSEQNSSN